MTRVFDPAAYDQVTPVTREQQLEAALRQLWAELCQAYLIEPTVTEEKKALFYKTARQMKDLGLIGNV